MNKKHRLTTISISYENYLIIVALADSLGLVLTSRRERNFMSRFGTNVVEDILEFTSKDGPKPVFHDHARSIAIHFLKQSLKTVKGNLALEIRAAIDKASKIEPSPIYSMDNHKVRLTPMVEKA